MKSIPPYNTSIERKHSIGSNWHSAISHQLNTFEENIYKSDMSEIYILFLLLQLNADGPVKSHFSHFSVIPAEAGIQ